MMFALLCYGRMGKSYILDDLAYLCDFVAPWLVPLASPGRRCRAVVSLKYREQCLFLLAL